MDNNGSHPGEKEPATKIERAAMAIDSVATRGAARAWLAAGLRVVGLCVLVVWGPSAILDVGEAVLGWLRQDISGSPIYTQEFVNKVVQALRLLTPAIAVCAWTVVAARAARIAAWAFPILRRCHTCGYTIGRLDRTTAAARCPECGANA